MFEGREADATVHPRPDAGGSAEAERSVLDGRDRNADSQADELQSGSARLYLGELWAVEGEPRADVLDALRLWTPDLESIGLSVSEGGVLDALPAPTPAALEPGPRDDTPAGGDVDARRTAQDSTDAFLRGYAEGGGDPALSARFLRILACESTGQDWIDWTPGNSDYRSAAQFHPQSWERVEREVGRGLAFEDPYAVGLAVATWVRLIGVENIAGTGGWPVCGRR